MLRTQIRKENRRLIGQEGGVKKLRARVGNLLLRSGQLLGKLRKLRSRLRIKL